VAVDSLKHWAGGAIAGASVVGLVGMLWASRTRPPPPEPKPPPAEEWDSTAETVSDPPEAIRAQLAENLRDRLRRRFWEKAGVAVRGDAGDRLEILWDSCSDRWCAEHLEPELRAFQLAGFASVRCMGLAQTVTYDLERQP